MINELFKKIEAQDKIINTQVLEIARLNKKYENAVSDYEQEHYKVVKAIEYIKENFDKTGVCVSGSDLPYSYIEELLEILGDKE